MQTRIDNPETTPSLPPTDAAPLVPGTWALDPTHAHVGFAVRHMGLAKVRGRFAEVDAQLVVGPTPDRTSVTATVALASLDTGNPVRDGNVRGPDVLDVERRPTMTFRSTAIHGADDDWTLEGEVTIGEVTAPLTLAVELAGVGEVFGGARHAGFAARGRLRRDEVGLSFGPAEAVVGRTIDIELDLEFVEPS